MSILTIRELEFLASLNTRWRRLYWHELALLLKEDGVDLAEATEINATGRQTNRAPCRMPGSAL